MRIPLLAPLAAFACGVWAARLAAIDSNRALTAGAALAELGVLGLRAPDWRVGLTGLACAFALAGLGVGSLEAPHHGSRNSTSDALLKLTDPTVAIVSAGFENLYGHPHAEVIYRLARRHVSVLRIDLDGAATVSSDGWQLEWKAQRHTQEDSR